MRDKAPDGESLEDFVSRISDDGENRKLLPQLEHPTGAVPSTPAAKGDGLGEIVSGRTRIRRINEKLLVAL
jgi:hypothetical protein